MICHRPLGHSQHHHRHLHHQIHKDLILLKEKKQEALNFQICHMWLEILRICCAKLHEQKSHIWKLICLFSDNIFVFTLVTYLTFSSLITLKISRLCFVILNTSSKVYHSDKPDKVTKAWPCIHRISKGDKWLDFDWMRTQSVSCWHQQSAQLCNSKSKFTKAFKATFTHLDFPNTQLELFVAYLELCNSYSCRAYSKTFTFYLWKRTQC